MNEADTRAQLIDPLLVAAGWAGEEAQILREYRITAGRITTGSRARPMIADYILVYRNVKLAVLEAKSEELDAREGVMQAKEYALKLGIDTGYSCNGHEIYHIDVARGAEGPVNKLHSPQELWEKKFGKADYWRDIFNAHILNEKNGTWQPRFYQELAIQKVLAAIAQGKERILLTLATGTGKTDIAFQISWALFASCWSLERDGKRRPNILFLADRNILADQAYNKFGEFPEDARARITASEIKKRGKVPTNANIFFTIFQTFMTSSGLCNFDEDGEELTNKGNTIEFSFGAYEKDFFDFIIVDECHRGGAQDESAWRGILEYFSPAVQLGLTATPRRTDNADTYKYFGEPVYQYSLKEGINDGFLTPFKVKRISTTIDDYRYTEGDFILDGEDELDKNKLYEEKDFNKYIVIEDRERYRVQKYLNGCDQHEKAIIFCATQEHAALVRNLINQHSDVKDTLYCVRVTSADGKQGELYLRDFQDNEKTIPTILTTSQKLSTGVDALNIRNIVLMRPVNSMIEFKQIIGRGTRLYDAKYFFTIYDFVGAYKHFADAAWDGEADEVSSDDEGITKPKPPKKPNGGGGGGGGGEPRPSKIKIQLRDGRVREIQSMVDTSFWDAKGRPVSQEEFLNKLFGELPNFFKDEKELCKLWSDPRTRKNLLVQLDAAGFPKKDLELLQKIVDMEKSDLYDVLAYIFNSDYRAITRAQRVAVNKEKILAILSEKQRDFIDFVLEQYIKIGVEELDDSQLPLLIESKYHSAIEATQYLGDPQELRKLFIDFQKYLYANSVA